MRKYLAPSALILILGLGLALAQTITKSVQLSQDNTGPFGVDANFNVYFPAHILNTGNGQPLPTITGTGTPSITGTDTAGIITMGNAATTAIALFGRAFVTAPVCVLGWQAVLAAETYSASVTGITITQTGASANAIGYTCFSKS